LIFVGEGEGCLAAIPDICCLGLEVVFEEAIGKTLFLMLVIDSVHSKEEGQFYPVKEKCDPDSSPGQPRSLLGLEIFQDLLLLAEERQELQHTGSQSIRGKFGGDETLYSCGNGSIDILRLFGQCSCTNDRDNCILAFESLDQVSLGVIGLADGEIVREGGIGLGAGQSCDLKLWGIDEGVCNELSDVAAGL
jgi:hypothetical protein